MKKDNLFLQQNSLNLSSNVNHNSYFETSFVDIFENCRLNLINHLPANFCFEELITLFTLILCRILIYSKREILKYWKISNAMDTIKKRKILLIIL